MADSANGVRDVGRSRACEQIMSRQDAKTQSAKSEESGVRIQEPGGRGFNDAPTSFWLLTSQSQPVLLQPPVKRAPAQTEGFSSSPGVTTVAVEGFLD